MNLFFVHILLLCLISINMFPQQKELDGEIHVNCHDKYLNEILKELRAQTGVKFVYDENLIQGVKLSCNIHGLSVNDVLKKMLEKDNLAFEEFSENSFVLYRKKIPRPGPIKTVLVEETTRVFENTHVKIDPVLLKSEEMKYPEEAIKTNISGNVKLKLFISKTGDVLKSIVDSSSGFAILDSVSIQYSKKFKFIPAKADGESYSSWFSLRFEFNFVDE